MSGCNKHEAMADPDKQLTAFVRIGVGSGKKRLGKILAEIIQDVLMANLLINT